MSAAQTTPGFVDEDSLACWCCGNHETSDRLVHLGSHPEVVVCLRCAHVLHHRARAREDALQPSLPGRARDAVRAGRSVVMRRGWQHAPLLGPVLRWLGQRLP